MGPTLIRLDRGQTADTNSKEVNTVNSMQGPYCEWLVTGRIHRQFCVITPDLGVISAKYNKKYGSDNHKKQTDRKALF